MTSSSPGSVTCVTAFHLEVFEFMDVEAILVLCSRCGSLLRSWEMKCVPAFRSSAAAVPVVGECISFACPAAYLNCTLVPGIVPHLPPTLFSVVANKTQLLPSLHMNHVTGGWCSLTGPGTCVYVQCQDE